jgi:uncharacterized protein
VKCPRCPSAVLMMTDRSGIEIDYCPDCRGVWLDRGELDKIIERSAPAMTTAAAMPAPTSAALPTPSSPAPSAYVDQDRRPRRDWDDDDDDDDDRRPRTGHGDSDVGRAYGKKKKKSFLGDIFDF